MSCKLEHKEAVRNTLKIFTDAKLLEEPRIVPYAKLDSFKSLEKELLEEYKLNYGLDIPSLFDYVPAKGANAQRGLRVNAIDSAFNTIDQKRMDMGLYDAQTPIGQHNQDIIDVWRKEEAQQQELADQGEYVYAGEVFPSKADRDNAKQAENRHLSFQVTAQAYNPVNFSDVIEYKKLALEQAELRLAQVTASNRLEKSKELQDLKVELTRLVTQLQADIAALKEDPDTQARIELMIRQDMANVKLLLASDKPSIGYINQAETIINYLGLISNYTKGNKDNKFVSVETSEDIDNISPEIRDMLDNIASKLNELKTDLLNAKMAYLTETVEKTPKIKSLFPGMEAKAITEELLKAHKDVDVFSKYIATVEDSFTGSEPIMAQVIRNMMEEYRDKNKSQAAKHIQDINNKMDKAKAELVKMGYGLSYMFNKTSLSEVKYDLFYQKTGRGNKTGRLVHRFSHKWFSDIAGFTAKNTGAIAKAKASQEWKEVDKLLVDKYKWLNENTDFIQLQSLPEIQNLPEFQTIPGLKAQFESYFSDPATSAQYSADLKAKLGEHEYQELVNSQVDMLREYISNMTQEIEYQLRKHNVTTTGALPADKIHYLNIYAKRTNPFEFIDSHNKGQQGRVDYNNEGVAQQYQSQIKYNSFIPKVESTKVNPLTFQNVTEDTGYYDQDFETIMGNPALMDFWETLSESTRFINEGVNDAQTYLNHNSLLRMTQSFTDLLYSREGGVMGATSSLLGETRQTIKDSLSSKRARSEAKDMTDVSKRGIETIEAEVSKQMEYYTMQLSRTEDKILGPKSYFNLNKIRPETAQLIESITGLTITELKNKTGDNLSMKLLKEFVTHNVMEEQTFNLPLMMKAYLDIVSEYKAQREAMPEIMLMKDLYSSIKRKGKYESEEKEDVKSRLARMERKEGTEDKRTRGMERMNYWINKNVKGAEDNEDWGAISHPSVRLYSKDEKKLLNESKEYVKYLEDKLNKEADPAKQVEIQGMIDATKILQESLGKDPSIEALINVLFNKRVIMLGLAWNPKAQIVNRAQGWLSGMINDTGRYWPEGAFYSSSAFVNKKVMSIVPNTTYSREMLKCKLLIERMDVIQDNTNEIDRARRKSGVRSLASKFNPYYLIEVVEWHNQVPQILSMMQGMTIKHATELNENGEPLEVKVFDGAGFPAFEVENGRVKLKKGFDTEENKRTWEDFTSKEAGQNKRFVSDTIAFLNGDYSKLGSVLAKKTVLGKSYMLFKTWVSKQALLRFGVNQSNINLGSKDFDGAYTGALKSNNTRVAGMIGLGASAVVASVTTAGVAPLLLGGAGLISYAGAAAWAKYKGHDIENTQALRQGLFMLKAILNKTVGIPVNTISALATGKVAIKAAQPNSLNLSEEEKQNLRFIVNECAGLLTILWMKILVKAMLSAGDDDDEPETILVNGKSVPNPNYINKKDKTTYNLLENILTSLLQSSVLWQDPVEMLKMAGGVQTMDRFVKTADDANETFVRELFKGNDIISAGADAGDSFFLKKTRDNIAPALFKDVFVGEPWKLGFGSAMKKEYITDEWVDYWMQSDFKSDKAKMKVQRKENRQELIEFFEKKLNVDELEGEKKERAKKKAAARAEKVLNKLMPANIRNYYDKDQDMKDKDPLDFYQEKLDSYIEKIDDDE